MNPEILKLAFLGESKGRPFKFPGKVRLTIGRKSSVVPAIIDTGAGATLITFNMLRNLGVRPEDLKASSARFGIRRGMTTYTVMADRLEVLGLSGCAVENFPLRAQSFILGSAPFGEVMLCGTDLIQTLRMKISVQSIVPRTVLKVLCGIPREGNPRDLERSYAAGNVTFHHKKKSITVRSVFDTGATFVSIPSSLSLKLGLRPKPLSVKAIGVTAMLTLAEAKIDSMEIAGTGCRFKSPTVYILRGVPFPIIGTNFMKATKTVLDFSSEPRVICPR